MQQLELDHKTAANVTLLTTRVVKEPGNEVKKLASPLWRCMRIQRQNPRDAGGVYRYGLNISAFVQATGD